MLHWRNIPRTSRVPLSDPHNSWAFPVLLSFSMWKLAGEAASTRETTKLFVDSPVPCFPCSSGTAGKDQLKLLLNLASVASYLPCTSISACRKHEAKHRESRGEALPNEQMQTKCRNQEWTLPTIQLLPFPSDMNLEQNPPQTLWCC